MTFSFSFRAFLTVRTLTCNHGQSYPIFGFWLKCVIKNMRLINIYLIVSMKNPENKLRDFPGTGQVPPRNRSGAIQIPVMDRPGDSQVYRPSIIRSLLRIFPETGRCHPYTSQVPKWSFSRLSDCHITSSNP